MDVEKAKFYYELAANHNSPEGHYSLGMLYLDTEGKGHSDDVNIPQGMVHLAIAARSGHRSAINTLAMGIYDPDSWLHQYERRIQRESMMTHFRNLTKMRQKMVGSPISSETGDNDVNVDDDVYLDTKFMIRRVDKYKRNEERRSTRQRKNHVPSKRWAYVPGKPIFLNLPNGLEEMKFSFPLSETENTNHMSLCHIARELSKHLAEMNANTNKLMKSAVAAYMDQDYYTALDQFDELSELGVAIAHESKIIVYCFEISLLSHICG